MVNLSNRGWQGDTKCVFCQYLESADHLFIYCSYINMIWKWIGDFNGFIFNFQSIQDLWILDAYIPLKDSPLLEFIRGAILWCVWLEMNKVCFNGIRLASAKSIRTKILSMLLFWWQVRKDNSFLKLSLILPSDVKDLLDQLLAEEEEIVALLLSLAEAK